MWFSNQRPGYPIRPPAVARHLVFRLAIDENPRWKTEIPDRQPLWKNLCDRLALHLTRLREAHHAGPVRIVSPEDPSPLGDTCFSAAASSLIPINPDPERDGYRLRVRLDVHTELFSLTYIFDNIEVGSAFDPHLQELCRDVQGNSPASDWLLDGMWEGDLPAARVLRAWLAPTATAGEDSFGPRTTDFRGIIICPGPSWPMGPPKPGEACLAATGEPRLDPVLMEFAKTHDSLIRAIADPHALDGQPDGVEADAVGANGKAGADRRGEDRGGESVICGMLGGKALYASSLGEWGSHVETPHPIRHLLVYAGRSYTQLGRLVRRMHVLGELRHAAVMDFAAAPGEGLPGLIEASRHIRVLGTRISKETRAITRARGQTTEGDAATGLAKEKTPARAPMTRLQDFVEELAAISERVDGGLTHRVEQSRYYAGEFANTIPHLRLVQIDGWQSYDAFVQRYVTHLFARINRIGIRYEALGRRVDRLLFFQQARLLDAYTQSVDRTVADIRGATETLNASADRQIAATEALNRSATQQIAATTALNESAARQYDVSEEQSGLLRSAEQFAIVFLIYYVGTVAFHLFDLHHRLPAVLVSPEWVHDGFLIGWAALIGYCTFLLVRHHRRGKRAKGAKVAASAVGAPPQPAPTPAQSPGPT